MNRDVFRLAIVGSRGNYGRPLGIVAGIAVGVALFLTLLSAAKGLDQRDQRSAWLNVFADVQQEPGRDAGGQALVWAGIEYFDDLAITRRDVALIGDSALAFPWGTVPKPGTYFASPAMQELIESTPSEQLGSRFGAFGGLIPMSGVASPDSLLVVVGKTEAEMRDSGAGTKVVSLAGQAQTNNDVYKTIIVIGGIATFFPVLLFVAIVTHLGAAQRSERFSTIRMIGGGPSLVAQLAAIEMAILSTLGSVIGVGIWLAVKPIAACVPIDEGRFFVSDLGLTTSTVLLAGVIAVAGTTTVSVWQIMRAGIGPLGVTRQQMERAPSPMRVLPLLAGVALMTLATRTFLDTANRQLASLAVIAGFGLIALGVVLIGPWVTSVASRIAARFVSSAAGTIAASSIKQHPARTFRSVSGLVIAVFVASVFAGAASSVLDEQETPNAEGALPLTALTATLNDPAEHPVDPAVLDATKAALDAIPGVTSSVTAWIDPETWGNPVVLARDAELLGLTPIDGANFVSFDLNNALYVYDESELGSVEPVASIDGLRPYALIVMTDGTVAGVEEARTTIQNAGMSSGVYTRTDLADRDTRKFVNSMSNLAYIGIALTILIAGISLSVSTVSAIIERKRIFGLLRLVGMPQTTLRNVIMIEAILPLVAVVGLSIGFGYIVAWLIVDGLSVERSIAWPDRRYVMTIVASTLLAAASVLATVRLARASTETGSTRFE